MVEVEVAFVVPEFGERAGGGFCRRDKLTNLVSFVGNSRSINKPVSVLLRHRPLTLKILFECFVAVDFIEFFLVRHLHGADDLCRPTSDRELIELVDDLAPDERRALAYIAEYADLIDVDGVPTHLLVPVPEGLLEILAAVGSETDDRENDLCDEPDADNEDDDGCGDLYFRNGEWFEDGEVEHDYR